MVRNFMRTWSCWCGKGPAICRKHYRLWSLSAPSRRVPVARWFCRSPLDEIQLLNPLKTMSGKLFTGRTVERSKPWALKFGTIGGMTGVHRRVWPWVFLTTLLIWEILWMKVVVWLMSASDPEEPKEALRMVCGANHGEDTHGLTLLFDGRDWAQLCGVGRGAGHLQWLFASQTGLDHSCWQQNGNVEHEDCYSREGYQAPCFSGWATGSNCCAAGNYGQELFSWRLNSRFKETGTVLQGMGSCSGSRELLQSGHVELQSWKWHSNHWIR